MRIAGIEDGGARCDVGIERGLLGGTRVEVRCAVGRRKSEHAADWKLADETHAGDAAVFDGLSVMEKHRPSKHHENEDRYASVQNLLVCSPKPNKASNHDRNFDQQKQPLAHRPLPAKRRAAPEKFAFFARGDFFA
jgi:hypothetical protein